MCEVLGFILSTEERKRKGHIERGGGKGISYSARTLKTRSENYSPVTKIQGPILLQNRMANKCDL